MNVNTALQEIETVHRYLDECYVNDRDEGCAVPLIDRCVLLVSRCAKDGNEVARLRSLILQAYNDGQVNDGFMRLALNVDETTLSQDAPKR